MIDRKTLIADISLICEELDHRNSTPPGTAERGVYFHCWPPADCGEETLTVLRHDAICFLAATTPSVRNRSTP